MNHSPLQNQNTMFSGIKSVTGLDFYQSNIGSQHNLPHITQPILAKYRTVRNTNNLIIQQTTSLWCKLFNIAPQNISLCKCERNEDGLCEMVIRWVGAYYDWKADVKFVKAYHSYSRRNIEIFLSDGDLQKRLLKKLQILGVSLGERQRKMLLRVCKNYLKHTVYYNRSEQLSRQNDLWMWFTIGIYYHIGTTTHNELSNDKHEEEILFWSVDIIMNHFANLTRSVFQQHITKIMGLMRDYFPKWFAQLTQHYSIDIEPIVYEWMNELMIGYMGIESIGFFIDCLLKTNTWNYVYKIFLSYFQKRMEKMESDEVFKSVTDREVITKLLLNCSEEWPLIFCNANSFCFDKGTELEITR